MDELRLSGVVKESIVDGPGIRLTIFSQGCKHNCVGCHNPHTHSFSGGELFDITKILDLVKSNPLLDGVTFSGGDPFEQAKVFAKLGKEIKKLGLNIVTYTGYLYEEIIESNNQDWKDLLEVSDILIDGVFKIEERSLDLKFRGSRNQRVINVQKSLQNKTAILENW